MGDDVRFNVLANVEFHCKLKDTNQANKVISKKQRGFYNDYEVSFDSGAIYLPKYFQK